MTVMTDIQETSVKKIVMIFAKVTTPTAVLQTLWVPNGMDAIQKEGAAT